MCIKANYNSVLESNDWNKINNFMDDCYNCVKYGSCDYLGYLDEKLIELETKVPCVICGELDEEADMKCTDSGFICDRCQRAIESRC
jgi:hypothetical protein